MAKIVRVHAREILDSRGNPAVENVNKKIAQSIIGFDGLGQPGLD